MGYIHNVMAVMVADDIAKRRKIVLSKLQQELFDLMNDEEFLYEYVLKDGEDIDEFLDDLKKDLKKMNAAELRQNIKLWKEDISFGRKRR